MSDRYTVIVDGVRSAIGIKNGQMIGMRSDDLSSQTIKALLDRNLDIDHKNIEDIVLGCAFPEGPQGMLMAKGVAILSGLPETTTGKVVNRFCGSSMQSIHNAAGSIVLNAGKIFICAGIESMSRIPMAGFNPMPNANLYEDRPEVYISMGETAENVAKKYQIL